MSTWELFDVPWWLRMWDFMLALKILVAVLWSDGLKYVMSNRNGPRINQKSINFHKIFRLPKRVWLHIAFPSPANWIYDLWTQCFVGIFEAPSTILHVSSWHDFCWHFCYPFVNGCRTDFPHLTSDHDIQQSKSTVSQVKAAKKIGLPTLTNHIVNEFPVHTQSSFSLPIRIDFDMKVYLTFVFFSHHLPSNRIEPNWVDSSLPLTNQSRIP